MVIVGAAHKAGTIPESKKHIKGYVRGFDVNTGKRLWIFHTFPLPGEFGLDTWENDSWSYTGNAGVGQISVDEELGSLTCPSNCRPATLRRPSSRRRTFRRKLLAVDLQTGKRIWHYQLVHHGLWDMDIPCAPMLVDIPVNGKIVKAVAQPTKQNDYLPTFSTAQRQADLADRGTTGSAGQRSGRMVFDTQPIPSKPPAYDNQGVSEADLIDFTPGCCRAETVQTVSKYELGPLFTPPVVSKKDGTIATLVSPGMQGGTNWPGGPDDPETHMLYVFSESMVALSGVVPPGDPKVSDMRYVYGKRRDSSSSARP